jgi:hypothetical protein
LPSWRSEASVQLDQEHQSKQASYDGGPGYRGICSVRSYSCAGSCRPRRGCLTADVHNTIDDMCRDKQSRGSPEPGRVCRAAGELRTRPWLASLNDRFDGTAQPALYPRGQAALVREIFDSTRIISFKFHWIVSTLHFSAACQSTCPHVQAF